MENQEPEFKQKEYREYYTPNRRPSLPNATAVLVLGIMSIPTSFCYGFIGITLGIIALVLAKKDKALYAANPEGYDGYSNLNTGRILAIIGIVLSIIYILILIFAISMFGWAALQDQDLLRERMMELQNQ